MDDYNRIRDNRQYDQSHHEVARTLMNMGQRVASDGYYVISPAFDNQTSFTFNQQMSLVQSSNSPQDLPPFSSWFQDTTVNENRQNSVQDDHNYSWKQPELKIDASSKFTHYQQRHREIPNVTFNNTSNVKSLLQDEQDDFSYDWNTSNDNEITKSSHIDILPCDKGSFSHNGMLNKCSPLPPSVSSSQNSPKETSDDGSEVDVLSDYSTEWITQLLSKQQPSLLELGTGVNSYKKRTVSKRKTAKTIHQCTQCDKVLASKTNLKTHMNLHERTRPFVCDICDKSFAQRSTLSTHRRIHTGEKPYKCGVSVCQRTFGDYSSYVKHSRTHTGERPYVCKWCNKSYTQSGNLIRHVNSFHCNKM